VDAITSVAVDARTVETITGTVEELVSYREAFTAKTITGLSLYTAVTEDTAASAAELLALADPSTGFNPDVDLISIGTIDGTASNIELLYALQNDDASVSYLGGEAIDLTDAGSIAATVLTDVAALTSGLVTSASVTTITGAASEVKAALDSAQLTSLDAVNATITDADLEVILATSLSAIGGATSGVVTVTNAIAISGTAAAVTAALVTEDTLVVVSDASVVISDSGSLAASVLTAIAAATTGDVTTVVTSITGTAVEVQAALGSENLVSLGAMDVTISDADAVDATDLVAVAAATTG
jgi:hypothetical protein